ncbi:MAG TPA: type II secretion system F family protein [Phycisphaerales bacterium]|nr:type II secretion system F family protein [Phycisphaerales bacterium]
MPSFLYQSLTSNGQTRTGVIVANDRSDAVRQLLSRGETATRLEAEATPNGKAKTPARRMPARDQAPSAPVFSLAALGIGGKPTLSRSDMATLMRELATAIEAGLPLMQSLRTVRKQAAGRGMPVILDHLIERVEAGDTLHKAARDYGPPFDDMVLGMLRAADASGEMSTVLHQLADLLERSLELRREVMGATFYPMLVAGLIAISAVILVTVLVPNLIGPLTEGHAFELPWPTVVVLGVAEFLKAYWFYCLLALALIWFGWRAWIKVPANRFKFDLLKLRTPVLGRLLRDVAVARFTRTLGTLTSAGLPILDALRITQQTLVNRAMMAALDEVQEKVTSGKSLADPLERSGLFPPLLVQVVNLGERSGRLESMLMHAATAFDRQVNVSLKLFTKALPPFLLVLMASVAGFVLAAILLPLLQLQTLVN